jgi:hypothetical protein
MTKPGVIEVTVRFPAAIPGWFVTFARAHGFRTPALGVRRTTGVSFGLYRTILRLGAPS